LLFDSESGRRAIKRQRGLKAWRTRVQRFGLEYPLELAHILARHSGQSKRFRNAIALLSGQRSIACNCSGCFALKYGADIGRLEHALRQLEILNAAEMKDFKARYHAQQHEKAMAKLDSEST
jgi:hypothetical protein